MQAETWPELKPFENQRLRCSDEPWVKDVRHHIALRLFLQPVVADGGCGLQRLIDVARIEEIVLLLGVVGPHPGETVRLQFDAHLNLIGVGLARGSLLRLRRLRQNAEFVLDVMADFVGDHISFGEFAGLAVGAAAELVLQVVEERGIEIDALVARAIERPHRRLREGAWRRFGTGKQPQLGRMVGFSGSCENLGPAVLGVAEHQGDELAGWIGRRTAADLRRWRALLRGRAAAGQNLRAVQKHARVDTEVPADQADDNDRSDPEAARSAWHAAATRCTGLAIVFDIVAGPKIIGTHMPFSIRKSGAGKRLGCCCCMPENTNLERSINQVFPGIYCLVDAFFS